MRVFVSNRNFRITPAEDCLRNERSTKVVSKSFKAESDFRQSRGKPSSTSTLIGLNFAPCYLIGSKNTHGNVIDMLACSSTLAKKLLQW